MSSVRVVFFLLYLFLQAVTCYAADGEASVAGSSEDRDWQAQALQETREIHRYIDALTCVWVEEIACKGFEDAITAVGEKLKEDLRNRIFSLYGFLISFLTDEARGEFHLKEDTVRSLVALYTTPLWVKSMYAARVFDELLSTQMQSLERDASSATGLQRLIAEKVAANPLRADEIMQEILRETALLYAPEGSKLAAQFMKQYIVTREKSGIDLDVFEVNKLHNSFFNRSHPQRSVFLQAFAAFKETLEVLFVPEEV